MRILEEETFGPVAPIVRFTEEAEAIRHANDTPFGLAAYLWTRDLSRAFRVAEALDYGIVGVNDGLPSTAQAPFGGMKSPGWGAREGSGGLRSTWTSSTCPLARNWNLEFANWEVGPVSGC